MEKGNPLRVWDPREEGPPRRWRAGFHVGCAGLGSPWGKLAREHTIPTRGRDIGLQPCPPPPGNSPRPEGGKLSFLPGPFGVAGGVWTRCFLLHRSPRPGNPRQVWGVIGNYLPNASCTGLSSKAWVAVFSPSCPWGFHGVITCLRLPPRFDDIIGPVWGWFSRDSRRLFTHVRTQDERAKRKIPGSRGERRPAEILRLPRISQAEASAEILRLSSLNGCSLGQNPPGAACLDG